MLQQSVLRMQHTIAKRALGDEPTASAEQWFTKNLHH
jgi:hypothetical protein